MPDICLEEMQIGIKSMFHIMLIMDILEKIILIINLQN
jgi:hypothetical protein